MDQAIEGIVLDLDGTVYLGDEPIPGAAEAITRLQNEGIGTLFFSNNPTKSRRAYADRLDGFGIDIGPENVLSAGTVTTRYLCEEHPEARVFFIGSEGLKAQFESAGVDLVADATIADVLVVSWTREFSYGDLLAGYRAIEAGATFYGTDPDRLIPAAEGKVPGTGAIVNAVAGTVDRQPEKILGKPSEEAQEAALEALSAPPERCVVVGDRLNTDIALGERAGMETVLVRTGVSTDADIEASDVEPDYVVDSLADIEAVL